MPLKLVVFDLDGTLASTADDLADAVNMLRRRLGFGPLRKGAVTRHVGQGAGHLLRNTIPRLPEPLRSRHPDLLKEWREIYRRRCLVRTRLYPGIKAALGRLSGGRQVVRMAVLTNKPGDLSRRILRGLGVARRFRAIVGGDEMRRRKPHPAAILDLMRRFRATPRETIVVGDSRFDMEAGRRAGAKLAAVTWGFGSRRELARWRPDAIATRASDLPAILLKAVAEPEIHPLPAECVARSCDVRSNSGRSPRTPGFRQRPLRLGTHSR